MDMRLEAPTNDFHDNLKANLPRLRRYGLALTRNHHAMEDLVQETVLRALSAQASFQPGTNFGGWLTVILRNEFVSGVRRIRRPALPLDDVKGEFLVVSPSHEDRLMVRELTGALDRLPRNQRDAIFLSTLVGLSHLQIAAVMGCRLGTVKSRISRARDVLQHSLQGVAIGDKNLSPPNGPRLFQRIAATKSLTASHRRTPHRVDPVMQAAIVR
jgi:RNA polymerase sigma-70 factor (ECF subfamily)